MSEDFPHERIVRVSYPLSLDFNFVIRHLHLNNLVPANPNCQTETRCLVSAFWVTNQHAKEPCILLLLSSSARKPSFVSPKNYDLVAIYNTYLQK